MRVALPVACLLLVGLGACGGATNVGDGSFGDALDVISASDARADAVDALAPDVPHDTAPADVAMDTPMMPAIESPCGRWSGTSAWSCGSDGHTLTRTISGHTETASCPDGCVGLPFGFDDQCRVRTGTLSNTVNGHAMSTQEAAWVHYVAYCVVPVLQGTRDTRLTNSARVTWWALKEGVLDVSNPNPVGFSLCTTSSGDVRIGPTATCAAGSPWQVGASGVQVPCCTLSSLESSATTLFPGMTSNQVLAMAATEADYLPGTATATAIVNSTGSLRASWLLRSSPIGFTFQAPIVTNECITGSRSWCFSTAWTPSAWYAPSPAGATQSISDLQAILSLLAP